MAIDPDTLDLLERRFADKVEAQVRDKLFRFYRALWAIALVALGFFGYNVVSGLTDAAKDYAGDAVADAVTEADAAADRANSKLSEVAARLEAMDAFHERREAAILENESRLAASQAKVDSLSAEIDRQLVGIQAKLGETAAQLEAQRQRATETAGIGNLEDLRASLVGLAEQVKGIGESVVGLEARVSEAGGEPLSTAAPDPTRIATIIAGVESAPPLPAVTGTVYLQFAGVEREVALGISAALDAADYDMAREERIASATGLHEVRFFHAGDRARAERLVADVNQALAEGGFRADVTLKDLTRYGTKPREGVMELWLEPVHAARS